MTSTTLPLIHDVPLPAGPESAPRPGCGELRSATGERLPLKALSVDTKVVGLSATSSVTQRFVNDGPDPIEATYIFPLPARAGVTDFVATLAGRRVVGILKERGEARVQYEEAISSGQRAAIVEEDRPDVFTVRVGNVGAGEEAIIDLVMTGPLEIQDGEATFRFPLVVAPRYTTGTPVTGDQTGSGTDVDTDVVGDASRVTPPRLRAGDARPELSVTVSVDGAGLRVSDLRTSLHSSLIDVTPDGVMIVRLQPGERADRDFLLRLRVDRSKLATSAVLVPDAVPASGNGEGGTWSVTIIPPAETSSEPRDVVVVLDRSGSMGGWKMVAARRAAGRIVDMLDAADRFCVLAFDDQIDVPDLLPVGLVEASDRNRFTAVSWLGSLESRWGTEMAQPLVKAADMLASAARGRRGALVLVTDGEITGEDDLLRKLRPRLKAASVHCVGVDRAVNAGFLDRLSRMGHGSCQLVESEDRLDEVMGALARTIGRPSLTGIEVVAHGIEVEEGSVTPTLRPDAFAGVPCVLSGRYHGTPAESVVLAVKAAGAQEPVELAVVPSRTHAMATRTIWARALLRDLEDEYVSVGTGDRNLRGRIVDHSVRFGVLSRFTAFLAVDPERTDPGMLEEITQPVESPSGWASSYPMTVASPASFDMVGAGNAAPAPLMIAQAAKAEGPPVSRKRTANRAFSRRSGSVRTRSLEEILRDLEQALGDPSRGLAGLRAELSAARDAASGSLRGLLTRLLDAVDGYVVAQGTPPLPSVDAPVRDAVEAVRIAIGVRTGRSSRSRTPFWERRSD